MKSKLIHRYYRKPHTKQERSKWLDSLEQGVKPRQKRSPARLPTNYDDIHVDKAKTIPYNENRPWKNKSKAKKQWERINFEKAFQNDIHS